MTEASDTLQKLTRLIAEVVASPYSDFYRKLYGVPAGSVPNRTYQQGVDEGLYTPLTCVPLVQTAPDRKHKRMFRH